MARGNVPKFGNWENQDVPYTVCFDKARKNRVGGKMINPNDPQENPDMFPNLAPPPVPPPAKHRTGPERRGTVRPAPPPVHGVSRDNGEHLRQFVNSPAPSQNMGQRTTSNGSNYGVGQGNRPTRSARAPSSGSELSFEHSPVNNPNYQQAKVMGRGSNGSPAWEGKNYDSSHGTPGRPRVRPASTRGDESPADKGAAVLPRFGEWDEKDPHSAENFTHIFNKVREERNNGTGGNVSGIPKHQSYGSRSRQAEEPMKCCFPWW